MQKVEVEDAFLALSFKVAPLFVGRTITNCMSKPTTRDLAAHDLLTPLVKCKFVGILGFSRTLRLEALMEK